MERKTKDATTGLPGTARTVDNDMRIPFATAGTSSSVEAVQC